MDAETARRTRHRVLERIEAEAMTVAGVRFPEPDFGRLARVDGRRSEGSVAAGAGFHADGSGSLLTASRLDFRRSVVLLFLCYG